MNNADDGVRGGQFYDDPGAFKRYQEHRRGGTHSPNDVMEEPAIRRLLGDVTDQRVLDLGCGDARFGRTLLDLGASSYLGIDGSAAMVEKAEGVLAETLGEVRRGDLEDLDVPSGSADLIISRLALHYVEDLTAVLRACCDALTAQGRLLFTVVHPVLTSHETRSPGPRTSWVVDDYFTAGPRERSWMGSTVTWYHRSIEQHLDALRDAGFALTALSECAPDPSAFGDDGDELQRRRRVPLYLLLSARKNTTGA